MAGSEIRVGRISSINYETGMARTTYRDKDETVTAEFPIMTNNDEYRMPEVGQDVLVAHLSNGSSRGAILGTLWNKKYAPKESGKGLYRKDFSKKKNAAYARYDDATGEYLLKSANVHINGVHTTVLDGPQVEVAANLSILLQTDAMTIDVQEILIYSKETEKIDIGVKSDVELTQSENELNAKILKAMVEFVENLEIKAGTDIKISASDNVELKASGELILSDGKYSTTLTEIMEKLEAMGGEG